VLWDCVWERLRPIALRKVAHGGIYVNGMQEFRYVQFDYEKAHMLGVREMLADLTIVVSLQIGRTGHAFA